MKTISIITINLNNKDGLRKTAESVVSQTAFSEIEWIVIDGGSTDGSMDIIAEYRDKMAYCVSEPDKGIYNAMNKGIVQACGEYILFMNSGDSIHDAFVIEKFLQLDEYGDYDYYMGRVSYGANAKGELSLSEPVCPSDYISFLKGHVAHQGLFIRRSQFKENLYDETFRICADMKFFWKDVIFRNARYCPIGLVVADFEASGISSVESELVRDERERCLREVLPPLLYENYIKQIHGDSLLQKIILCLPKKGIEISLLTAFAGAVFFPRWIKCSFVRILNSIGGE